MFPCISCSFINNLLIRYEKELENFGEPDFIIFNAGHRPCNRYTDGMSSSTSINISFDRKEMILLERNMQVK